tara:strand:+ start:1227 stop:2033 length:807 start_codon:yes stop_codon:yes gene_type:complete
MSVNLDSSGLSSIINDYDLFYIDIWGVLHNGIKLFKDAEIVLDNLNNLEKEYVLLTNAPRPNTTVISYLKNMGLSKKHCDKVYTSGQAALNFLSQKYKNSKFFHIGPSKDFDLFFSLKQNKTENINECDFLLCTGLFEEHVKDLNFYKDILKKKINLKMICTNPDLIVDRGDIREYCAGKIAEIFEDQGGEVEYFGKPYPLVYNLSADQKNKNILCIGDNLKTDIKGANIQKFNSLLILSGIHKNDKLKEICKRDNLSFNFTQSYLKW